MSSAKSMSKRGPVRVLVGHVWGWFQTTLVAAALGGTMALGALRLAPSASAEFMGPLACKAGQATVAEVYTLQVQDWTRGVWTLNTPQLRCMGSKGVQAAAEGVNTLWYGGIAGWAALVATLGYLAWAVIQNEPAPGLVYKSAKGKPEPEEDYPAQFLAECCEVGAGKRSMTAAELYAAYVAWSRAKGHRPAASKALTRDWRRLGLKPRGLFRTKAWRGVRLKQGV